MSPTPPNRRLLVSSLVAALAAAACGDDASAPRLEEALLTEDVAMVAADAALADLDAMNLGFFAGFGAPEPAADGVLQRSVTYYDAEGREMPGYHPRLTASVRIRASFSRSASGEGWSASVGRSRDLTVSGLLGIETERRWDGSGEGEIARSVHRDGGATRIYEMSYTSSIDGVVRAVDRAAHPWPLSGAIARELSATRTDREGNPVSRSRTAVLTFNGTQFATLVVDGETFTVDLAQRGRKPVRGG